MSLARRLFDRIRTLLVTSMKSGVSPKVVSERLGHTSAAFTMQTYMHVIPGMDAAAANQVADLILGGSAASDDGSMDADLDARSER